MYGNFIVYFKMVKLITTVQSQLLFIGESFDVNIKISTKRKKMRIFFDIIVFLIPISQTCAISTPHQFLEQHYLKHTSNTSQTKIIINTCKFNHVMYVRTSATVTYVQTSATEIENSRRLSSKNFMITI